MAEVPTRIKNRERVKRRREQIISAATRLFSRKGFHKTTLRNLAEEAGISHGNIYDYIGSKEDILFLIHENSSEKIIERIKQDSDHIKQPLERLRRMIISELNTSYNLRQATLLFYQETKSLPKERRKQLLRIERKRLKQMELVIEECVKAGQSRPLNSRLISNFIKVMTDIWPLKSWDLAGHTTRHQIEKMILDAVFNGFLQPLTAGGQPRSDDISLGKRSILLINSGGLLGDALVSYLLSQGARIVSFQKGQRQSAGGAKPDKGQATGLFHEYTQSGSGSLDPALYRQIIADCGPVDTVITCWEYAEDEKGLPVVSASDIDLDFNRAIALTPHIQQTMVGSESGTIIHIAPSYWVRDTDRNLHASINARIQALTRQMSLDLGPLGIRVNNIIPGYIDGMRPLEKSSENNLPPLDLIPLGRLGRLEDLLETLRFLLSNQSGYLTGQSLNVGGGMT